MFNIRDWVWCLWRDLTWARKDRREWLAKMQRYYDKSSWAQHQAKRRVFGIINQSPCDWDANVPVEWAKILVKRWGIK